MDKKLKIANKIAREYSKIKSVIGITLGGSIGREVNDRYSDIEIYIYYQNEIPSVKEIKKILKKLDAKLSRSNKIHWQSKVWGVHTFFKIENIKIELGYREYNDFLNKIKKFLKGEDIPPKYSTHHDTPFGHYIFGVMSCIKESKTLFEKESKMQRLKKMVQIYPTKLKRKVLSYYLEDVIILKKEKLKFAYLRNDTYHFDAVLANIIRSIVIILFTLNDAFFAGDKWNKYYLNRFRIKPKNFDSQIKKLHKTPNYGIKNKEIKYKIIDKISRDLEKMVKDI